MIMTHTHAKRQGQRLLGSNIEWKQTDGQTEAIALPPVLTRSVKIGLKMNVVDTAWIVRV